MYVSRSFYMMNKLLKSISALALVCLMAFGATACGEGNWKGNVALTNKGEVVSNGGFVAETENYVYFINGEENYTENNALGTPVKGALMVADKGNLDKPVMLVPKILAAQDYTAGVYVLGDRVYYATPSTKKDTNGKVANDHIEFCSTDLAGNGRTEHLTVKGVSTLYRFAEKDGKVYIVYYDSDESQIVSYDITAKKSLVIAESPAAYNFTANEALAATGVAVIYTVKGKNENTGADANFNDVYAYTVGAEKAELVVSGKGAIPQEKTYAVTLMDGLNVYYTETPTGGSAKYYGATVAEFVANGARTEYTENTSLIASSTLFVGDKAYAVDGDFVMEYSDNLTKKTVAAKVGATTLLFVDDGNLYYINSANNLARVKMGDAEANEVRVSSGTVVTDWYKVKLAGGKVFWLDNSEEGFSYVNYVATNATVVAEDTDDDEKDDLWYLDGVKMIGVMNETDKVNVVTAKLKAVGSISRIVYEDGKFTAEEQITKARAAYTLLADNLKKKVSEDDLKTLETYEKYLAVSKELKVLIDNADIEITAENKAEWQAKIDKINKAIKDNEWSDPDTYLIENGMWALKTLQKKVDDVK